MKKVNTILTFLLLLTSLGFSQNYPGGQNIDRTWFKPGREDHRKYSNTINEQRSTPDALQAPGNDNCANATVLTLNSGCLGGQTTTNATLEGGECTYGGTRSEERRV